MVRIVVLNDNRKNNPQLENEHGLSLYIEVDGYKILLDVDDIKKIDGVEDIEVNKNNNLKEKLTCRLSGN